MIDSREFLQIAYRDTEQPMRRIAARDRTGGHSSSVDFARTRLISDLANCFELDADALSAILVLIGQVRAFAPTGARS